MHTLTPAVSAIITFLLGVNCAAVVWALLTGEAENKKVDKKTNKK